MKLGDLQPGQQFDLQGMRFTVVDHTPGRTPQAGLTATTFHNPRLEQPPEQTFNSLIEVEAIPVS